MGDVRQPSDRPTHLPNPIHYCPENDERTIEIEDGSTGGFHLELSVSALSTTPGDGIVTPHSVTAIGGAKIYLSYRDRLYSLFKPDWTYPIDYCINHVENNVAIIVANVPILRGLVTRWVFNFRTKATPMEREFRNEWQWNSSSNSSTFTRITRRKRVAQKIMPCIQDDFSSSLARSRDMRDPDYPPRIITTDYRKNRSYKSKSRKSRRNSTEKSYETADSCEKGDMLETVRSIGSLGSAPTLVDTKDMDWKSFGEPGSPTTLTGPRRMSSPMLSPISPLAPCLVREVDEDDEIYPFP
jgi:hypothetical protein